MLTATWRQRALSKPDRRRSDKSKKPQFYPGLFFSCAGPQLDFPAQQFLELAEVWLPFEESTVIGWR